MTNFDNCKATFAQLLPDLECMAASCFQHLAAEARNEAIQNTIALAWKSYHALILQGRGDEPGMIQSVLWYSVRQTRSGRKVEGESRSKDAFKYAKRGRAKFETADLNHFISDDLPVPDAVSFRLDVPQFLATLNERQRRMAQDLMEGMSTTECALKYGVTPAAISQFRSRFKLLFDLFMAA